MDFAKRIDALRNERRWSYYRLSVKSGIPLPTILSFAENKDITLSRIEKLCKAFGITLMEFFKDENIKMSALSPEQKQFLVDWSALMPEDQKAIYQLMNTIISEQK